MPPVNRFPPPSPAPRTVQQSQKNPFDDPARHNREIAARRAAEQQATSTEEQLRSQQAFADMEKGLAAVRGQEFPPGFSMPPAPVVGDRVEASFPSGRVDLTPPTQETGFVSPSQQDVEDAEREAALRAAGVVQQAPPPMMQTPPSKKVKVNKPEALHPVLRQLRMDLGLDHQKTINLTVADHVWSFYPLTPELTTLALRIAEIGGTADAERVLLHQYAAVCCSIVAIDKVPVWQVFGIMPEKDDDVTHTLLPKGRIRQRAALALLQELMTNSKLGVISALLEAYNAEVDPSGAVKGHTAYKDEKYFKYVCPVEDCSYSIVRSKRFDKSNEELPYHCEMHGIEMDIQGEVESLKEGLNPLA